MIRKSFQLIRTNPLLTTNLKLVVTSKDLLYLESFNSSNELSDVKYKHYRINKNEYLEDKIPDFYAKMPSEIAYKVRYDNDASTTYSDYSYQYDTLYFAGAARIEDRWYQEEFEYLSPLYIRNELPSNFIILRVDDPSNYSLEQNNSFEISSLNNVNFFSEILDKWKCVQLYDLTTQSNIGKFLEKNYTNNKRFPESPLYFDSRRTEFSKWRGMDYDTGIYTEKDVYLEDTLSNEQLHYRYEKFITEGYKNNKLIYPNILNLKFLFDDTPATPDGLKKYSMNRYYGFYIDSLNFVGSITSYRTPEIKSGLWLINNIIVSGTTGVTWDACDLDYHWLYPSINPFVSEWDDNKDYYIFLDNTDDFYRTYTVSGLYPVKKIIQNGTLVYKIISDEIMDQIWNPPDQSLSLKYHPERVNMKTCDINYEKFNILTGYTNDFFIDKYLDVSGNTKKMFGDLYLINIDNIYHVLKDGSNVTYSDFDLNNKNDVIGKYYIQSDWGINNTNEYLEYWIVGKNTNYYRKVLTYEKNRTPNQFKIYKVKFSDIKDFDFDRVETEYSNFDYEKTEYVDTIEEKLHAIDYTDTSIPRDFKLEKFGYTSQFKVSNVSSEYVADDELFELTQYLSNTSQSNRNYNNSNRIERVLSDLWRKNQTVCKWGFMGSNSHSDYAYKLNNNLSVGGVYNRTCDPFYMFPNILYKNLDYFYRIGNFKYNTDNVYYKNQTTNIEGDYIFDQYGDGFNIDAYFNTNFDYFTFFFKNKMNISNNGVLYTKNYDKYSVFNNGDDNNLSVTLFKGLKIFIKSITNFDYNTSKNLYNLSKNYNGYKFSIILNDIYDGVSNGINDRTNKVIDTTKNGINIILNDKFKNILIIINFNVSDTTIDKLNNTEIYNEKEGLYYGLKKDSTYIDNYNSNILTAYSFINSINNNASQYDFIRYYYITDYNNMTYSGCTDNKTLTYNANYNNMVDVPSWNKKYSPFLLNIAYPDNITISSQNKYNVDAYYADTKSVFGYSINEPIARIVNMTDKQVINYDNNIISTKNELFRFSGPYEPVFKDINVFDAGMYYYTSFTGTTVTLHDSILSKANYNKTWNYDTNVDPPISIPQNIWENTMAMCNVYYDEPTATGIGGGGGNNRDSGNNQSTVFNPTNEAFGTSYQVRMFTQVNVAPYADEVETKKLFVGGFDFGLIPSDAIITGITVTIKRRAKNTDYVSPEAPFNANKYCYDSYIHLTKDYTDMSKITPNNYALVWDDPYWLPYMISVTYPDIIDFYLPNANPLWETTWTVSDITNPNFGVLIGVKVKNNTSSALIIPQIECVTVGVSYMYDDVLYTFDRAVYMDNNLKFNTELNDFGMISELIYSKVNENANILKINPNKDTSMYPMIDEYGYSYSSKFIFKSPWDKEFFVRTNSNIIINDIEAINNQQGIAGA
jgi:hypothetical protein